MLGYKKYSETMLQMLQDRFKALDNDDAESQEFKAVLCNRLSGKPGPTQVQRKQTSDDKRLARLSHGWEEISECRERLGHSEVYVRQYPTYRSFKTKRITKVTDLRYHIEKYFEEMYILKERLKSYIKVVESLRPNDQSANRVLNSLKTVARQTLYPITRTIRGSHVHNSRYRDSGIDRLVTLGVVISELHLNSKLDKASRVYFKSVYSRERNEWARRIQANNKEVDRLLDAYFDALYPLVFSYGLEKN